ncbi:MAG: ATPase V [Nitrosopumilaceae archaeon]
MGSLLRTASKLQEQKFEAIKLRRQNEREFQKIQSLAKKSTSGLASLQRRIDSSREELGGVSGVLTQKLAQQESIQRLIAAAEERLKREKDAKEQTEQELEFADSEEEKQRSVTRLRSISDRMNEFIEEIKHRNKMAKKVTLGIEEFQKSKSYISSKIQKQTHSKPDLQKLIKKSKKTTQRLAKKIVSKTRQEQIAKQNLAKINKKLSELAAKRRKLAASRSSKKKKIQSKKKKLKVKKIRAKRTISMKTKIKHKKKTKIKHKKKTKIKHKKKTKTKKTKPKKKSKTQRKKSIKSKKKSNKKSPV